MNLTNKAQSSVGPNRGRLTFAIALIGLMWVSLAGGQTLRRVTDTEFGPVMRSYLGYLRNEQEVVDDRVSRREVSLAYYRRNSNRIRALRQMAIQTVRETGNDYIPELEAVTHEEMRNIFEKPPSIASLAVNGVVNNTFRFLGVERTGEIFYVFARLDPYEQAELMQKSNLEQKDASAPDGRLPPRNGTAARPRRVTAPE